MTVTIPAQNIKMDVSTGIDPIWYDKIKALTDRVNYLDAQLTAFNAAGAYAENVWTPVITSAGGTAPTFTNPTLTGVWIKVGHLMFLSISGNNTAGGTPGAGAQQLSVSLPFAVRATALPARITCGSFLNNLTQDLCFAQMTAGATTAPLYQQNISGSKADQVALTGADLNNATRGVFWRFYYGVD
jgi:hypothetical protein